jgi:hypothetical protein
MEQDRLPKQAYQMLLLMEENEKKCWASDIKNILGSSGFYFVWLNQGVEDVKTFLAVFRQRLVDNFMQEWSSTIREKDRYDMYRSLKSDFGSVDYILDIDIYCF